MFYNWISLIKSSVFLLSTIICRLSYVKKYSRRGIYLFPENSRELTPIKSELICFFRFASRNGFSDTNSVTYFFFLVHKLFNCIWKSVCMVWVVYITLLHLSETLYLCFFFRIFRQFSSSSSSMNLLHNKIQIFKLYR